MKKPKIDEFLVQQIELRATGASIHHVKSALSLYICAANVANTLIDAASHGDTRATASDIEEELDKHVRMERALRMFLNGMALDDALETCGFKWRRHEVSRPRVRASV